MMLDCSLLKNGIHLAVDGSTLICCLSKNRLLPVQFKTESRNQQLSEDWTKKNCSLCLQLEEKGITSMRQHMNGLYPATKSIDYVDIRRSNQCNMACAMCSSDFSSLWSRLEGIKAQPLSLNDNLESILANISGEKNVFLHLAGGEPLIIREHFDIFNRIKKKLLLGRELHLQITTNLSLISKDATDMFEKADFVRLCVSIDAVGSAYDYIRYPFKFAKIEGNLKKISEYPKIEIVLQPTISLLNIFNLDGLVDFFLKLQNQFLNPLFFAPHPLIDPDPLSLFLLPAPLKKRIISVSQNLIEKIEPYAGLSELHKLLLGIVNSSSATETPIQNIKDFLNRVDSLRGSFLKKENPRLYSEIHNL